ncbi:MAG: hypothetical protein WC861_05980 [Candidatus Micrarchaeia archaeon]
MPDDGKPYLVEKAGQQTMVHVPKRVFVYWSVFKRLAYHSIYQVPGGMPKIKEVGAMLAMKGSKDPLFVEFVDDKFQAKLLLDYGNITNGRVKAYLNKVAAGERGSWLDVL